MQAVKAGLFGVKVVCVALDLQSCATCQAPRVSLDMFDMAFSSTIQRCFKGTLQSLKICFAKSNNKIDRTSAKSNAEDRSKHLMKKERIHECVACKTWRCIFAVTNATAAQMEQLSEITNAIQYSCGDHESSGILIVRQDASCADLVDKLYYSCRKFEEICCWCGALEPQARINDETRAIYKVVNPVCQERVAARKRPCSSKLQEEPNGRQQEGIYKLCLSVFLSHLSCQRVSVLCS